MYFCVFFFSFVGETPKFVVENMSADLYKYALEMGVYIDACAQTIAYTYPQIKARICVITKFF